MNEQKEKSNLVSFTIDGTQVTVPKGTTVYTAATKLGIDIPIFCYQSRMPPFGACRMCLVEVEKMGKPQTSCTLEATEGMVVHTQSEMSREGRKRILELLLINHPLDCPICDKGGECPLQDNTMKFGPGESRFYEEKRHFEKPIALSSVLMLDRERCIVCARCTRFGEVIAGDHALQFIERGFKTEVGVPEGKTADSKFIGNTIAICPVGALTSKVYRFKARPWDNKSTDTTCTLCPVGCSMIFDERDGEVMRTRAKQNRDVNDMWLCDKGWFGYEFSDHRDRLKSPMIRKGETLVEASWDEAFSLIASKIEAAQSSGKVAGFGGNPLTTEENYLFQKLIREGGLSNHVDHRIGMPAFSKDEEGLSAGMEISIGECEDLNTILLLGIDLTEEFPVIWLRLKQAINKGAKVIFLGHYAPEITAYINEVILHPPGEEIGVIKQHLPRLGESAQGKKGAVFLGSHYLNSNNRAALLSELMRWRESNGNFSLNLLEGRGNFIGAQIAGMRPDRGPFGEKIDEPGLNALQVLEEAARTGWDYLHVAGANPAAKFPKRLWEEARKNIDFLVVQDLFLTETAEHADVVLPTLCFMEKYGHFVNIEGRPQKIRIGKDVPKGIHSDGDIFIEIALKLNFPLTLDQSLVEKLNAGRIDWHRQEKIENAKETPPNKDALRATFASSLFDEGIRMQHDPHLLKLVKEPFVRIHPEEASKRHIKNNDKVKISSYGNSIEAIVRLDDGVAHRTAVLPLGFSEVPVHNLAANLINGLEIEMEL